MVVSQVVGNDAAVAFAGASGTFELNVQMPVMARCLLESVRLLANVSRLLADRTVDGLEADEDRCLAYASSSPSIVTPLNKHIGYEAAAAVAKQALKGRDDHPGDGAGPRGTSSRATSPRPSSTRRWTSCAWPARTATPTTDRAVGPPARAPSPAPRAR